MKNKLNYKLINVALIAVIIYIIYLIRGVWLGFASKIIDVSLPFILAFAIAYALYPFVKKLTNLGLPRWLSIAITCFIAFGIFAIMIILIVPLLYDQVLLLLSNISTFISDISSKFNVDLGDLQSSFNDISTNIVGKLGNYVSDGAVSIVNSSISIVTTLIVVLAVSVYILKDMDKIREYIKKTLKRRRDRSYKYVKVLDTEISNYFTGLGMNMIIQFFEYTFAFLIIGHPNYLILGLLASLTTIIPYFGGLIIDILALVIAAIISKKLFILTAVVCLVCPFLDGYVIGPKVYGKTNDLNPVINIFAVFAGGILLGFWGIVIALPVTIIIKATYKFFKNDISDKIVELKEKV